MSQSKRDAHAFVFPRARRRRWSEWDLYRFGIHALLRTSAASRAPFGRVTFPFSAADWLGIRYVLEHLDPRPGQVVIDLGSSRLLSLFLAARAGVQLRALDPRDDLTYPNGSVDRIFSASGLLEEPDRVIGEISGLLKPEGIACLAIPWADPIPLGEAVPGSEPERLQAFYRRAYESLDLEERLLRCSELELVDVSLWMERHSRLEGLLMHSRLPVPGWMRGPALALLSSWFSAPLDGGHTARKKLTCVTLRKPVG